jgi:hypothetical protein
VADPAREVEEAAANLSDVDIEVVENPVDQNEVLI